MIRSRQILACVPLSHEHRHAYDPPGVGAPDEDAGYEVLDHAHQVAVPQQHVHLQLGLETMVHDVFTIMVHGGGEMAQILHDSETSREGSSPAHLVLPDYCLGDGQREVHLHPLHLRPTLLQTLLYLLQVKKKNCGK